MNNRDNIDLILRAVVNSIIDAIERDMMDCSKCKYFEMADFEPPCHDCRRLYRPDKYSRVEESNDQDR